MPGFMEQRNTFGAPWSTSLKWLTGLSVAILATIAVLGLTVGPRGLPLWWLSMVVLPLAILLMAPLFMIRGYEVAPGRLLVRRLGWTMSLDLEGLLAAEADPQAMRRSLRTFGNGGLFCFAGAFYNSRLGSYRAFATDPARAVVLRFPGRVVVVTPDDPQALAGRLTAILQAQS